MLAVGPLGITSYVSDNNVTRTGSEGKSQEEHNKTRFCTIEGFSLPSYHSDNVEVNL